MCSEASYQVCWIWGLVEGTCCRPWPTATYAGFGASGWLQHKQQPTTDNSNVLVICVWLLLVLGLEALGTGYAVN